MKDFIKPKTLDQYLAEIKSAGIGELSDIKADACNNPGITVKEFAEIQQAALNKFNEMWP